MGYFLEFDIHYPKELNELHSDLQFVRDKILEGLKNLYDIILS